MATPQDIVALLSACRFSLAREKETQAEMAALFDRVMLPYERERDIGRRELSRKKGFHLQRASMALNGRDDLRSAP